MRIISNIGEGKEGSEGGKVETDLGSSYRLPKALVGVFLETTL